MAKPRVFVSSTYYDLKHIRRSVEQFIESLGYEAAVFESGDIPFSHDTPLDDSCNREVGLCHILVLIIGGRYGSPASGESRKLSISDKEKQYEHYNSITRNEYLRAREQDIPIYIFVEKGVLAEFQTFRHNRDKEIRYAHVDSVNIFKLLEDILSQPRNNFVREFATADDITSWLRDQWAGLLSHFITQRRDGATVGQIRGQIESLTSVVQALKTYSEQVLRNVSKDQDESEQIIAKVHKDLKSRHIFNSLNHVRSLANLMDFGLEREVVIAALTKAESYVELDELLDLAMQAKGWEAMSLLDNFLMDRDAIDDVREASGLPPLKI